MNDKNKTTLKIVLVILLGVALLAMLISCCVVGTTRGFKNSVAYAIENSQLTFITLDTAIKNGYSGVSYYGIRFNTELVDEEHENTEYFTFSIIGSSVVYGVSMNNEKLHISNGSSTVAILNDYYSDINNYNTFYVSQGFNIIDIFNQDMAPYIVELCTTPLGSSPTPPTPDTPTSESLNIIYFNKLSNGQWDTVENSYKSLGSSFWGGDFTDSAGSVIFNSKSIQDFIYYSMINFDGEVSGDYPFYYKDNKKVQLVHCPANLAFSIAYNKATLKSYDTAYNKGFSEGYSSGVNEGSVIGDTTTFLKTTFTNLGSLLDIRIFGNVTLGTIIGIPLILMVVLAVLKLVRG